MSTIIKAIRGARAYDLDQRLFNHYGFCLDQLMELAGLCVAICSDRTAANGKILICAGPGNNGGDGLVAARHLVHFGREVDLYYPKRPDIPTYKSLLKSAELSGVNIIDSYNLSSGYSQIVDAIFGFSFYPEGGIRAPFGKLIDDLSESDVQILSVDVPSGWNVDSGPVFEKSINPSINLSLSAPKHCLKHFNGENYLGGRFLPDGIKSEFNLSLPEYPDQEQIVKFEKSQIDFTAE